MNIVFDNAGKNYGRDWIFRHVSKKFESGKGYAIVGPNGSGKSTFLQVACGFRLPNEGKVSFQINGSTQPDPDSCFRYFSFSAPYMELPEELSLREWFRFQEALKPFLTKITEEKFLDITGLNSSSEKPIRLFSSGMKQRVKLAAAILSDTPVVFLDEPFTNLDHAGRDWYVELCRKFLTSRLVFVGSNHQKEEYFFCGENIEIGNG